MYRVYAIRTICQQYVYNVFRNSGFRLRNHENLASCRVEPVENLVSIGMLTQNMKILLLADVEPVENHVFNRPVTAEQ